MSLQNSIAFVVELHELMRKHKAKFLFDEYNMAMFSLSELDEDSLDIEADWDGWGTWIVDLGQLRMNAGRGYSFSGELLKNKVVVPDSIDIIDAEDLGRLLWARVVFKVEPSGEHGWFVEAIAKDKDTGRDKKNYIPISIQDVSDLIARSDKQ